MRKETVQEMEYNLRKLAKASVKPHTDFKYIGKGIIKQVKAKTAI